MGNALRRYGVCGAIALGAITAMSTPTGAQSNSVQPSSTVAGASMIALFTLEYGDTIADPVSSPANIGPVSFGQFWLVPLTVGDSVQVGVDLTSPSSNYAVGVWPPGTTDATVTTVAPVAGGDVPLWFTAPFTGTFVMLIGPAANETGDSGGPYSFAVAAFHHATAYISPSLTLHTTSSLSVSVRRQDGSRVTDPNLRLHLFGDWKNGPYVGPSSHPLGTSGVSGGTAKFRFHLPAMLRHHTIRVYVGGGGTGWGVVLSKKSIVHVT